MNSVGKTAPPKSQPGLFFVSLRTTFIFPPSTILKLQAQKRCKKEKKKKRNKERIERRTSSCVPGRTCSSRSFGSAPWQWEWEGHLLRVPSKQRGPTDWVCRAREEFTRGLGGVDARRCPWLRASEGGWCGPTVLHPRLSRPADALSVLSGAAKVCAWWRRFFFFFNLTQSEGNEWNSCQCRG